MKKEPSKGWLEFRAKAGAALKKAGAAIWAALKRFGAAAGRLLAAGARRVWAWLKANFSLEPRSAWGVVRDGVFAKNPLLVLTLGVTCALAATADLKSAVVMGCATLVVLLCTELLVSLLRNVIPAAGRRICALCITAAAVTAAGLVLQMVVGAQAEALGVYLPLLAVNCAVLSRVDGFAACHTPGYALLDALSGGLGYGLALAALGAVRELLGAGTLWGRPIFGAGFYPVLLLAAPCGGFLLLGILTAAAQWLRGLAGRKGGGEA